MLALAASEVSDLLFALPHHLICLQTWKQSSSGFASFTFKITPGYSTWWHLRLTSIPSSFKPLLKFARFALGNTKAMEKFLNKETRRQTDLDQFLEHKVFLSTLFLFSWYTQSYKTSASRTLTSAGNKCHYKYFCAYVYLHTKTTLCLELHPKRTPTKTISIVWWQIREKVDLLCKT